MAVILKGQRNSRRRSTVTFRSSIPFLQMRKRAKANPCRLMTNRRESWRWWWTRGRTSFSLELQVRVSLHIHKRPSSLAFAVADPAFLLLTRNRKIATTSSYHRGPQEKTCEETGRRFCHGQYRDGRFKHWGYVIFPSSARRNPTSEPSYGIRDLLWIAMLTLFRHVWQE